MRILIIEDEPDVLEGVAIALRDEGYAVDTAPDGEEGLYKALGWSYDAVVLDVMLPKKDGWAVLDALRSKKTTPVLMLTARDETPDRIRGLDTGADDYLIKPFDVLEMLARLRAIIRRGSGKAASRLEIAGVVVDTATKSVERDGQSVPLTAREYALVEYLSLHHGEVVSRTTLYEHLFDENEESLSNLLDVHVSNVRKKLGNDFITTRRGHGYFIKGSTP